MQNLKYAPRPLFEQILEYMVIPTFDLVIETADQQIILVYRKIKPYANVWALPGLRMMKPENIDNTIERIAFNEVGLTVDTQSRKFLGQYVGKFRTENNRQDLSTGYLVSASSQNIVLNNQHFSSYKLISTATEIPERTGAMYKYYLQQYFKLKQNAQ